MSFFEAFCLYFVAYSIAAAIVLMTEPQRHWMHFAAYLGCGALATVIYRGHA